ncbi:hypothetical protein SAMN05192559_101891 [Halobacillus karajensis]|uniref:Uncharacterized protein n=1 Tax=Halobacillus karajensis TaxID=195088 RepID=A0A059NYU9_9BACI|nr:hypothetical protein [Halobacillus karajensis]CDQ18492.1 hypothetical protein BN982_00765 [Halobacillus karajensis]CDQ23436.1 hypothetical protein BN983_01663 [Halobacillus karajensis]CDQ26918.1 hypothetical protein BN981_01143 [Halobacillus karajensis]SEH50773.1 hypothetical protein SAMN05192559_101891 [Halobacillus karajensis]
MLLFLEAIVLIVGSWYWFVMNRKKEASQAFLVVVLLLFPFLYFVCGRTYADYTHSQGLHLLLPE